MKLFKNGGMIMTIYLEKTKQVELKNINQELASHKKIVLKNLKKKEERKTIE